MKSIVRFFKDEEGVTGIEYGLLASLIAIAFIVGAGLVGTKLESLFQYIATKLNHP